MNWFAQNRPLGSFLIALGAGTVLGLALLCWSMSRFGDAEQEFDAKANELATLQRHNPFPSEANLRKMKTQAEEYAAALAALRAELQKRVLPPPAEMQPNEFQARLQTAVKAVTDKARANNVRLPENFFLGFEEFGGRLPESDEVPRLGQQLAQAELLASLLIDARVEAVTLFKRAPLPTAASPTPTPRRSPKPSASAQPSVERPAIEFTITGTPAALRRAVNQIATAPEQIFIVRTLHILNEKETGPPREGSVPAPQPAAPSVPGASPGAGLNFIVGNERVQAAARVEMVRFAEAAAK